jgi:class 3 adenylate cyclase/CHASE3 domain sensor protein
MRLRFTIFQKLLLGFAAVFSLTAIVAFIAIMNLMRTDTLVDEVISGSVEIKDHAILAESAFRQAITHEQHFLIHLDTASVAKFKNAIDTAQTHVWSILRAKEIFDDSPQNDAGNNDAGNKVVVKNEIVKKKAAELQRMIDQYFRGFGDIVWELSLKSDSRMTSFAEIVRSDTSIQAMYTTYNSKAQRASVLANEIVQEADISKHLTLERLQRTRERTLRLVIIISIAALLLGITLSFALARAFVRPILLLGKAAQNVASGMRQVRVSINTNDEVSELATSFNTMASNLDKLFAEIEEMFGELEDKSLELATANEQNQALLLNVLPETIAERLKLGETLIADVHDEATILFADIVGFTRLSTQYPAVQIVEMLNWIFSVYDDLTQQFGLEKIKTIGDSYMVAGGVPLSKPDHCKAVAEMSLAILRETENFAKESGMQINVRIGVHTGQVVAGVIGQKKFIYDLWGDTVNTASRMESSGEAGKVQISEEVYQKLLSHPDCFTCEERGLIEVKGKGQMKTYFLQHKD